MSTELNRAGVHVLNSLRVQKRSGVRWASRCQRPSLTGKGVGVGASLRKEGVRERVCVCACMCVCVCAGGARKRVQLTKGKYTYPGFRA